MVFAKKSSISSKQPRTIAGNSGLWLIAGLSTMVFLVLHTWNLRDRFLEFKWDGIALGNFTHLLWNLAQGLPVSTASGGAMEWFRIPGVLHLLAPLYRLWPSPYLLPLVQSGALAVAAGGIFFLGSLYLPRIRALILTLLFCFYPPIYAMSSTSFHPVILAVPFLTWMTVAAVCRRTIPVILTAILALTCDLRAGLLVLPVFLWLAQTTQGWRWLAAAAAAGAVGAAGWAPLEAEEGMGPVIFYGALTAPYFFWALSALEGWADRLLRKRSIFLALLSPIFFAGAVFASALLSPAMVDTHPGIAQLPVRKSAVQSLLEKIPANADVLTTPLFLPAFSNRANAGLLDDAGAPSVQNESPKFALVDVGGSEGGMAPADATAQSLRRLMHQGWGPISSRGSVVLFSDKPAGVSHPLYASVDIAKDSPYLTLEAKAAGIIELVGFTMSPDTADADVIHFSFYWRKMRAMPDSFFVQLMVVDAEGNIAHSVNRRLCYGLYPFDEWKMGETVKEEFMFVVPERLQNSSYEVRLALSQQDGTQPAPMKSSMQGALDAEGRVRLIALDAI